MSHNPWVNQLDGIVPVWEGFGAMPHTTLLRQTGPTDNTPLAPTSQTQNAVCQSSPSTKLNKSVFN